MTRLPALSPAEQAGLASRSTRRGRRVRLPLDRIFGGQLQEVLEACNDALWRQPAACADKPPKTPACRDPFDVPFLQLAIVGKADYLATGDRDLLTLASKFSCPIVTASGSGHQHYSRKPSPQVR